MKFAGSGARPRGEGYLAKRRILDVTRRLVATVVIASAACVLVLSGCTATPAGRVERAPTARIRSGPVAAAVLAVPYDYPPSSPRTVWVVRLDGSVTTRTVDPAPGTPLALSPDGRILLHATGPGLYGNKIQPPASLRALDLKTGRDSVLLESPRLLSYGWDSTGRVVALTSTSRVAIRGVTVWHGSPTTLASASVVTTLPPDASTLLASDGETAYFSGSTRLTNSMVSPTVDHLWRYDFATRHISLMLSTEQPGMPTNNLPRSLLYPPYAGAPPYSWQVPSIGLAYSTFAPTIGGPRPHQIDLLSYSDLRPLRSIIPTPTEAPEYFPAPIFDSTFSHYLARTAGDRGGMPLPSKIIEVDVATGRATLVDWPADPLARPIGYLGSTRSFLFMSRDPKGVAVALQEPGKKPRVLLRVRGPYSTQVTWPGILGVQYVK